MAAQAADRMHSTAMAERIQTWLAGFLKELPVPAVIAWTKLLKPTSRLAPLLFLAAKVVESRGNRSAAFEIAQNCLRTDETGPNQCESVPSSSLSMLSAHSAV